MKPQDCDSKQRKVAVLFIGNTGSGKSALLSQIGGDFASGVAFRRGFTRGILEQNITLNGKSAVLMDAPGLFEPEQDATHNNAKMLTEALKRNYDFKLFFVLKADNRGPPNNELILMSKVNECVHQAQAETRIKFTAIINQIMDDKVYNLYRDHVAHDKFRSLFTGMKIPGCKFNDIHIENVIMLRFDEKKIRLKQFGPEILPGITVQKAIPVFVRKDISVTAEDIKNVNKNDSAGSWFWPIATAAAVGMGAVATGGTVPIIANVVARNTFAMVLMAAMPRPKTDISSQSLQLYRPPQTPIPQSERSQSLIQLNVSKVNTKSSLDIMKTQDRKRKPRKVAVMFIGNMGSGKSDLLAQIGGIISRGAAVRRGSTWSISEQDIMLDGEPAVLMDARGLFERDEDATHANAKMLTEILRKYYEFKLFFVLKANNRGPPLEELILISKVHECVHQAQAESRIEFAIIFDQIMDDPVYNMYREKVAVDNFRRFFADVKIPGCSFNDIHIDNVIMLRFDTGKIQREEFGPEIPPGLIKQEAIQLNATKDISVTKKDIQGANKDDSGGSWFMSKARIALGIVVAAVAPLAGAAILTEIPRDEFNAGVAADADRGAAKSAD
ncbi:hypothetical protein BGZ99_000326 [Dissophora globulifera]|uniref:G domain-containing protein n=1 Tax=Dissophora globulifera TaxID=979702 RepID=A0A9P6R2H3_9FUNG|nr:hypothetical protein BGZ99_000326 [Dissophora globulifera]